MHIGVLMDPIEHTYPGETTHALGRELARRGHTLVYFTPADLTYESPAVTATVRPIAYAPIPDTGAPPQRGVGLGIALGAPRALDLAQLDVVLMRQDPPVDARYLAATYLLERLAPATLVVNDPRTVRDTAEKLAIVHFPELAPPTLVSADHARLAAFRAAHGDVVLKQLWGKGGDGIFFVRAGDKNWNVLLETLVPAGGAPIMAQRYFDLPSKKVVVVDGEILGALEIEPEPDDIRGNLDRGKGVRRAELTADERAAATRVAGWLGRRGILFGVIDLVGAYVIETNVTSPGIAFYFNPVHEVPVERAIADAIEKRARAGR